MLDIAPEQGGGRRCVQSKYFEASINSPLTTSHESRNLMPQKNVYGDMTDLQGSRTRCNVAWCGQQNMRLLIGTDQLSLARSTRGTVRDGVCLTLLVPQSEHFEKHTWR